MTIRTRHLRIRVKVAWLHGTSSARPTHMRLAHMSSLSLFRSTTRVMSHNMRFSKNYNSSNRIVVGAEPPILIDSTPTGASAIALQIPALLEQAVKKNDRKVLAQFPKWTSALFGSKNQLKAADIAKILRSLKLFNSGNNDVLDFISAITNQLKLLNEPFSPKNACDAISGIVNFSCEYKEISDLIVILNSKIEGISEPFSAHQITTMMYSLQNLVDNKPEVRKLLSNLTKLFEQSNQISLNGTQFGISLYGFRNTKYSSEVVQLIELCYDRVHKREAEAPIIIDKKGNQKSHWHPSDIAFALYGMRYLSCSPSSDYASDVIVKTIALLTAELQLVPSTSQFSPKILTMCVYGLQRKSTQNECVRTLLSELTAKIKSSKDNFSSLALSNCLYGLQNMDSSCAEVLELIQVLSGKIDKCKSEFNPQFAATSLFGLQRMRATSPQVLELLTVLTRKINETPYAYEPRMFSLALFGLQSMDATQSQVVDLLKAVAKKFENCVVPMKAIEIANSFCGLQRMSFHSDPVLVSIVKQIHSKLLTCSDKFDANHCMHSLLAFHNTPITSETKDVINELLLALTEKVTYQFEGHFSSYSLGNALSGLRYLNSKECPPLLGLLTALSYRLQQNADGMVWAPADIAAALSGFQSLSDDIPIVNEYLEYLHRKMKQCSLPFTMRDIDKCLRGLMNMSAQSESVKKMLTLLTAQIDRHASAGHSSVVPLHLIANGFRNICYLYEEVDELQEVLKAYNSLLQRHLETPAIKPAAMAIDDAANDALLADMFHSLRFCSASPSVIHALQLLLRSIESRSTSSIPLSPAHLANISFGLRRISADTAQLPICYKLIEIITQHIGKLTAEKHFSADDLVTLFGGLRNMTSAGKEVKALLASLLVRVNSFPIDSITAKNACFILESMQNMNVNDTEVSDWFAFLAQKVVASSVPLTSSDVARGLIGLRSSHSDSVAVRRLLHLMSTLLSEETMDEVMAPKDLARCFLSMNQMYSDCDQVKALLSTLSSKLATLVMNSSTVSISTNDVIWIILGMRNMSISNCDTVATVLELLVKCCSQQQLQFTGFQRQTALQALQRHESSHASVKTLRQALELDAN